MEILIITFITIIVGFLIFDLGFMNRQAHRVSMRSATYQSIFWVAISLVYGCLVLHFLGGELAGEFLSAYLTEKMLSVDNLFVIMLIFQFFKLDDKYFHRVLYWGILGAVIFRGIFITAGVAIVSLFHWVLYIFGAILVYTGIKLLLKKDDDDDDFSENRVYKLAIKYLPFTKKHHNGKFLIKEKGKTMFTTLFMVLLLVETTDIIFAFDSIPAVFSISQNWFIIFTSNIFAIMGLRALFFLIENIMQKFKHLQAGVSLVLIFIGGKMLAEIFHIEISSLVSLGVILTLLLGSLATSVLFTKNNKAEEVTSKK